MADDHKTHTERVAAFAHEGYALGHELIAKATPLNKDRENMAHVSYELGKALGSLQSNMEALAGLIDMYGATP